MSLFRNKHAGIDANFSEAIAPEYFMLDELTRFGFQGKVSTAFYDPVQSLLAIGTTAGEVHIFGQGRVHVAISLYKESPARFLRLYDSRLVVVDARNDLSVYNIITCTRVSGYSAPSFVSTIYTDPALDWVFLGLQNGEVVVYDVDREIPAPFRIPNLWISANSKSRLSPVISLALHPRDLGKLLIGYLEGALIFNFKENRAIVTLLFELPAGAPGADVIPTRIDTVRKPHLTTALWHPTGTFIMTAYDDSCMAFWDPKDGKLLQARTISDSDVHLPGGQQATYGVHDGSFATKEPLIKISWCCSANPDDTSLLIAGGNSTIMPVRGLTLFELGPTPSILTTSYQLLSEHFASPKRQRMLPTPLTGDIQDFCLIPRTSPHFAGCHDPIAILALLSSGELSLLSFPDGAPISAIALHPSLGFIQPSATSMSLSLVQRERWLGTVEICDKVPALLRGGAEAKLPKRSFHPRNIIHTIHVDGIVRIFDIGSNDEIENQDVVELDVGRTLSRHTGVNVIKVSSSSSTAEIAIALDTGEVIIYRWGKNKHFHQPPEHNALDEGKIVDISRLADPRIKEGFLPLCLINEQLGKTTVLTVSDIGFVAVGYEKGDMSLVDLRGPAIFYSTNVSKHSKESKRSSFRKSVVAPPITEFPLCAEFSIMTIADDAYSSICLHVATSSAHIATFKILPEGPRYTAAYTGSYTLDATPRVLIPINTDTGIRASADPKDVAALRSSQVFNGAVVCLTVTGARIIKPPGIKGDKQSWEGECITAQVVDFEERASCLLVLLSTGAVKAYSLSSLKEIGSLDISHVVEKNRIQESVVSPIGEIIVWTSLTEVAVLGIFGTGKKVEDRPKDMLYNIDMVSPPRPTISNFQWISGTQYIGPEDFDILIGGPTRPPSKKMLEHKRDLELQERHQMRAGSAGGAGAAGATGGGVFSQMVNNLNKRTEGLTLWSDNMEKLEESSANFADAASKFVAQQKKKAFLGGLKQMF